MTSTFFALFIALFVSESRAQDRELVRVNGTPILQSEVINRLLRRYGDATVDEMINELLVRQEAKTEKVKSDPAEVERRVARIRSTFPDAATFERQLKQSGMTPELLKEEIGEQIVQEKTIALSLKITVGEAEVKKAFDARKEELGAPAAVHLRHIMVKTEAEAKKVVARVKAGEDFAKLAKENSMAATGKLTAGDYGFVAKGMLPPSIEKVAFALKDDELKIVVDKSGSHILQSLGSRAAAPAEYAKVRDDLRELIMAERIKASLPQYLETLRKKADIKPMAGGR